MGLEAMLRARGVEPTSATFSEREVGGQRYPVAHAEQLEGWPWLANPAPQIAGACAATEATCMEIFDRIARVGLPTEAAFPPSDMNVAGLPLTVPQGCSVAMCLGYDPRAMPAAPEPCDQVFGPVTLAP